MVVGVQRVFHFEVVGVLRVFRFERVGVLQVFHLGMEGVLRVFHFEEEVCFLLGPLEDYRVLSEVVGPVVRVALWEVGVSLGDLG